MSVTGLVDDTEEREPRRELVDGDPELERMADEVHQVWCSWMEYMFQQGERILVGGPWSMNELAKRRWARQMITPYSQLLEDEKRTDREIARRYINIMSKEKGLESIPIMMICGCPLSIQNLIEKDDGTYCNRCGHYYGNQKEKDND